MNKSMPGRSVRRLIVVAIELALCGGVNAQANASNSDAQDVQEAGKPMSAVAPSASPVPPAQQLESVVVTGTRASLAKSLDRKRNALIVQDSISATELGRFPDDNVADSLTHVTGVTVSRTRGGEGQYISVRGLGSGYNIVTLNNRILATDGDGRDFAFDVLPSEVISGADVMKSAEAAQIEGSIGGSVNLRSARPLDTPGFQSSVHLEGDANDLSKLKGRKLSAVLSNTFANNTVGLMLGAVVSQRKVRTDSLDYHSYNPDAPGSYDVNGDGRISAGEEHLLGSCCIAFGSVFEEKKRTAFSGVLEWKPNKDFKLTFDALSTRLDSPQVGYKQAYYVEHSADRDSGYDRWSNVQVKDRLVTGMMIRDLVPEFANITSHRVVDTKQFGLNGVWNVTDKLSLTGDLYRSTSTRSAGGKDSFVVAGIGGSHTGSWSATTGALPNISVRLADGRDLAGALASGQLGNADFGPHWAGLTGTDIKDTVTGFSLDGKLKLSAAWHLDSLGFGMSATGRSKERSTISNEKSGGACQYCNMYSTTFASLGANVVSPLTVPNFMRNAGGVFPLNGIKFDVPAYFAALKKLDGRPILDGHGEPTGKLFDASASQAVLDPTDSYHITERTKTAYLQANFSGDDWNGNVGARVVRTTTVSNSAVDKIVSIVDLTPEIPTSSPVVTYSPATPVSETGTYTRVLPSANLSYWFNDGLVARLAAAQVIARPSLDRLAPTRTDSTLDRTYSLSIAGDPTLKPTDSSQQDVSLEWYFRPKSMLTGALFAKQIKNFVTFETVEHVDIGVPGYLYTVTRPVNGDKATVRGLEIGFQHLFDNGFGLSAKLTKTLTRAFSHGEYTGQLEGVAPTASSLAFLYEDKKFNAQVSFDYTSGFTQTTAAEGGNPVRVDPVLWVTASASYALNKDVSVFVEGKNLTDAVHRSYLGRRDASYGFETWGRSLSFGVNVKF